MQASSTRPAGRRALAWSVLGGIVTALVLSAMASGAAGSSHLSGTVALASSSSPFAASSPATSTTTTAPSQSATSATTVPGAHTGEAWASAWFVALVAAGVGAGALCLEPIVLGRRRLRVPRT